MSQLAMKRPQGASELGAYRASPLVIRRASETDADALARLLARAFPEKKWDTERVLRVLLRAPDVPVTFLVVDGETLLATASVRYIERFPESGYVHWVAVDPDHRGRQLSAIVMAPVLEQFAADGRHTSVLETDDPRIPAIVSYLRLGFVPHYLADDHEARWSRVLEQIVESGRHRANASSEKRT